MLDDFGRRNLDGQAKQDHIEEAGGTKAPNGVIVVVKPESQQ